MAAIHLPLKHIQAVVAVAQELLVGTHQVQPVELLAQAAQVLRPQLLALQ